MKMYHVFGMSCIPSACGCDTCRVRSNSPKALAALLRRHSCAAANTDFGRKVVSMRLSSRQLLTRFHLRPTRCIFIVREDRR